MTQRVCVPREDWKPGLKVIRLRCPTCRQISHQYREPAADGALESRCLNPLCLAVVDVILTGWAESQGLRAQL